MSRPREGPEVPGDAPTRGNGPPTQGPSATDFVEDIRQRTQRDERLREVEELALRVDAMERECRFGHRADDVLVVQAWTTRGSSAEAPHRPPDY